MLRLSSLSLRATLPAVRSTRKEPPNMMAPDGSLVAFHKRFNIIQVKLEPRAGYDTVDAKVNDLITAKITRAPILSA